MVDKTAQVQRYYTLLFPGKSKGEEGNPADQKLELYRLITASKEVFCWKFEAYADQGDTHYNLEIFVAAPHAATLNYSTIWSAAKIDDRLRHHKLGKAGFGKVKHGKMVIPSDAKQLGGGGVMSNAL
jgi:hypothetical protein